MVAAIVFSVLAMGGPRTIEVVRSMSYRNSDRDVCLCRFANTTPLFFRSKLSCDVDGSPNAYHPDNDDLALDVLGSAGGRRKDNLASGPVEVQPAENVVAYQNGMPYIQPSGEFAGFYVSKTSLENSSLAPTDPTRYLDARKVQFLVLPGDMVPEATLGDVAMVYDPLTKKFAFAVYGDVGPTPESGEGSLATLQRLGFAVKDGKSSPGETRNDLLFVVFPNTSAEVQKKAGWPLSQAVIDQIGDEQLKTLGGPRTLSELSQRVPVPAMPSPPPAKG